MRLHTFGRPHIVNEQGEEVALQPLGLAVLAYLAIGGPRDRTHLAELFWHNSKNGLNSLSTALNRIRAQVPDGVWVRGNTLVGTDLVTDISDLRSAIDRCDFEAVTRLYGAPFLGSLKLRRQSSEFEEWVLGERATLAAMVELTLLKRGRDLHDAGEYQAAATATEQAWDIAMRDGFPSPDYFEAYHRILVSAARPSATAVRAMAEEFGYVLPKAEPIAFDSTIDSCEEDASAPLPLAVDDAVPVGASTQLFGCRAELDAIESSVVTQKLTTIVGLGGAGKTRLASEFFNGANAERAFPHRYWVNLQDVGDHVLVAPAIAAELGHRFEDVGSLAERLPDGEPVLLVLDNFEHVQKAAGITAELTSANSAIRILVTSRVPLEVSDESLVQLRGLETSDEALDSPAEQLFVSSALRAGVAEDRLSGSSRTAIREVCRRVGGNPLALEIAGGWVQILSPPEIIDALTLNNELLGSSVAGDVRTMETVLQQAWSTLSETEQNTLMLLATFPAGCLTKEALKLPELPIRPVGRLVQHSLVRLHIEGRITLHPLVASHALAELEKRPDLQHEYQQVLATWCGSFSAALQADCSAVYSCAYDAEIPNFCSAWSWAARHGLWDLHRATLDPLRLFFIESGRIREGQDLFEMVVSELRSTANSPRDLLADVLEALGRFAVMAGDLIRAQERLEEALSLSLSGDGHGRAQILRSLGALKLNRGEIDEAASHFNAGLDLVSHEPSALSASLRYDLAQVHHYRGEREQAEAAARSALKAGRSTDNWRAMTGSYLLLADIAVESDPKRAIVLLNEGWMIAKEFSLDSLAIYFPHVLGLAHLKLAQAKLAADHFADGLEAANNVGQLQMACANYIGRAEARLLSDETAEAVDDLRMGIRLALKTGAGRYLMWAAVVSCRASAARDAPSALAEELLLLTIGHPATDQDARDKASETLRDLFGETAETVADLIDGERSLDEVAERSLSLLLAPE